MEGFGVGGVGWEGAEEGWGDGDAEVAQMIWVGMGVFGLRVDERRCGGVRVGVCVELWYPILDC